MNQTSNDWDNPYRAPEMFFEPVRDSVVPQTGFFWIRLGLGLQMLTLVIGLGLSTREIETIVGTGPALSVFGVLLAAVSFRKRLVSGIWFGVSAPVFSLAIFLLIFLLGWSPGEARVPVPVMGAAYLAGLTIATFMIQQQMRSRERALRDLYAMSEGGSLPSEIPVADRSAISSREFQ